MILHKAQRIPATSPEGRVKAEERVGAVFIYSALTLGQKLKSVSKIDGK